MLYPGLRLFMKLVLRVFFRKVYFSGAALIPAGKPVVLACNHPNSFLDAVLLAVLIPRPLHFLARSDVFNSPLKRWLLSRLHLVPVYRLEEGAANLHRNEETFNRCYEILKHNGIVLIFSEGICVLEKRLRPLRKGTARLAFGAAFHQQLPLAVQVVPVGINYTYPDRFRQEVMIGLGPPIAVDGFKASFQCRPARAMQQFNQVLRQELEKNIISIPVAAGEEAAESRLQRHRASCPDFLSSAWFSSSRYRLETEMALARNVPAPPAPGPDNADYPGLNPYPVINKSLWFRIIFFMGLPFACLALTLQALPLVLALGISRHMIRRQEFYASVLLVTGMVFYLVYWLVFSAFAVLAAGWLGLAASLLLPLSGYFALLWIDAYRLRQLQQAAGPAPGFYQVQDQGLQQPVG